MENKKKNIIITIIIIISIIIGGIILYVTEQNNYIDISNLEEMEENLFTQNEENIFQNNQNVEDVENNTENANKTGDNTENSETVIAIHITGEVKKPGLLYLKAGSRIADAIKEAGGATKNADLDRVNLAYVLSDGQKIYIPNKNEKEEKMNINTAEQTELETLPGIGPSLAQRIIEYRETNGDFKKIEDLQNVKGIGNSKYSNIKDSVCI